MLPWDSDIMRGKDWRQRVPHDAGGLAGLASPSTTRAVTCCTSAGRAYCATAVRGARGKGFAIAPVVAMRPALSIGLHGDRYIQSWFQRGAQGKLHFNYDVSGRDG